MDDVDGIGHITSSSLISLLWYHLVPEELLKYYYVEWKMNF